MVFYGETKNRNFLRLIYFHLISYIQTTYAGRAKFIRTYDSVSFYFTQISLLKHQSKNMYSWYSKKPWIPKALFLDTKKMNIDLEVQLQDCHIEC